MQKKTNKLRNFLILFVLLQVLLVTILHFLLRESAILAAIILAVEILVLMYLFSTFQDLYEEQAKGLKSVLGKTANDAYLYGGLGMIIYDEEYVITWMSELFQERKIDRVGKKVLNWIPEADDLISHRSDSTTVQLDDRVYEIHRSENTPVIFFKDITALSTTTTKYEEEKIVIGMASFDNYEESTQFADETEIANINTAVRSPLMKYCEDHRILVKRLNNYRYLLVLNEKTFSDIASDHFSVLNKVRKSAQKVEAPITLSMAFARGTSDYEEMDELVSKLMDLAQTRGGDQVAVQVYGDEVKYFGGSSEAAEKRSRVRVRVMSHTLRDLIMKSSNVIICGHKTADFDCIGSAICLSRMVSSLHKQVMIIARSGGIEEKLKAAMDENNEELKQEVNFVTENEAIAGLQNNTLVIMTDHHSKKQSNGSRLLEDAKRVVVIDHHRRSSDMGVQPCMIYIEAGASSTCELLTEMIPYVSDRVDISELDATMMLTGMIVDTNRYRVRTGARTYEAASALKQMGANQQMSSNWLKDSFEEFTLKNTIMSTSENYPHGIVIASITDKVITRTMMSQAADSLLSIQNVQAAFVIAQTSTDETAISARSAGKINVQVIMESMKGGGHMTAAAVQRQHTPVSVLKNELLGAIDTYFEEEVPDESDS